MVETTLFASPLEQIIKVMKTESLKKAQRVIKQLSNDETQFIGDTWTQSYLQN